MLYGVAVAEWRGRLIFIFVSKLTDAILHQVSGVLVRITQ